ncbi:response regulator [Cohnella rhizosphaerae]|uniref:Response regulator n=1 Tax=Cohnella rhizosphaerae TaxID=1457232 RepID=A0A9X4QVN3_9BACL|nr:response regulator [Cohnella rhizosphaerae]MDG0811647.1 response regulator [Cohnella rhizosphaerae]
MHRVMIVEDEPIVRYGIRSMIDWDKIGLRLAGEAANGREALALIGTEPPDILITDIKMPVMDGIELIAEVRKTAPDMKIIILSNLEDFQYAKEAIKHGVSEYLIKSDMMPRDFEQALLSVKDKLYASSRGAEASDPQAERLHKERLLAELADGAACDPAECDERAARAGLAPIRSAYVLLISVHSAGQGFEERQAAVRDAIGRTWTPDDGDHEAFVDKQGDVCVLCDAGKHAAGAGLERVKRRAEALIGLLRDECGMKAAIGIGGRIGAWAELKASYAQAAEAAKQKMFLGSGRVIVHGADDKRVPAEHAEPIRIGTSQIQSMVYAFQSAELAAYLDTLFDRLSVRRDPDLAHIITFELLMILTTLWPDVANDDRQVTELKRQYYDQLSRLETVEESRAWFKQSFEALVRHIAGLYNSDRNSIVKATQYIRQYYDREISLQFISGLVHLSKNYFANLFKKEVGESFLEYLTRIRIDNAKELLRQEMRTGDVGSLVGIPDPKYFSKVFKKITGLSPSEYRALHRDASNDIGP